MLFGIVMSVRDARLRKEKDLFVGLLILRLAVSIEASVIDPTKFSMVCSIRALMTYRPTVSGKLTKLSSRRMAQVGADFDIHKTK